mgnify:CR=1 FL=1
MARYIINGGNRLQGTIRVTGAKNSILPILAAVLLSQENIIIHDCPKLLDVENMIRILIAIGCKVKREGSTLIIDPSTVNDWNIPDRYVREIRSSIVFLGAMLARMRKAKITYPGGCEIGLRPINLHLKGLRQLGVIIDESGGYLDCHAPRLVGTEIQLDYPSVGATENIMLAASVAEGTTVIRHAAKEPEIVDLQNFINSLGGKIRGAGSNTIIIEGVERFRGTEYKVIPDRIVAGTFLVAGAITNGDVTLTNVIPEHIQSTLAKLREAGCSVWIHDHEVRIKGRDPIRAIDHTITQPYPGFPTDMQAQLMSLMTLARGTSIITEEIFENRFKHVGELIRMGANIRIDGKTAIIQGVERLTGAEVFARDLRGGAALVIAGLRAEGQTIVDNILHIDRGYEDFDEKLRSVGADIRRMV